MRTLVLAPALLAAVSLAGRPAAPFPLLGGVPCDAPAPAAGTNRVLVTHDAYIRRYLGPAGHGQIGERDAVVVRPLGEAGFEVLGRIRVGEWGRVATASR